MGRYWQLNCPYCKAELTGSFYAELLENETELLENKIDYGDKLPEIWLPFIRCPLCGKLIPTGSKEYLSILPKERERERERFFSFNSPKTIANSITRTRNPNYIKILEKQGIDIYPLENSDNAILENLYKKYGFSTFSSRDIQSLYDFGILLQEDQINPLTGELKENVMKKNIDVYRQNKKILKNRKILKLSFSVGIPICIIITFLFGRLLPYLGILPLFIGALAGSGSALGIATLLEKRYKTKEEQENKNKNE